MRKQPQLILLNGTSSAGKTSIVKCLQQKLDGPYLDMGLDKFLYMLPSHYMKLPLWQEVWNHSHAGDIGNRLMSGMHYSMKAMVLQRNLVLADHVLIEKNWVVELAELFHDLPAYFIGVHCPQAVTEQRELNRKDRTLGSAKLQHSIVHQWASYDFTVDSSLMSAEEAAEQILQFIQQTPEPLGFKQTRQKLLLV